MGGSKIKTVDMSVAPEAGSENEEEKKVAVRRQHPRLVSGRSKKYVSARRHIDRTKFYSLKQAIELLKRTSYSSFTGTITLDLVLKDKVTNLEVTFPHPTGKSRTIAIATEALIKDIEAGKIDFDVLLAEPKMMGKLAKHARVLGPRGLMPNPKNKTVTPDPEARKKELEKGTITIKTEKKEPLMHITVGKTDSADKKLIENIEHLIKVVGPKKIIKATVSATMSPGVKIDLSTYVTK